MYSALAMTVLANRTYCSIYSVPPNVNYIILNNIFPIQSQCLAVAYGLLV